MNDPHVEALVYVIEHDKSSDYSLAKTVESEQRIFRLKLEGSEARFELKEHYPTRQQAQQAIQPFIQQWELTASLKSGPGTFTLRFKRPEIIDRKPIPGVIAVSAEPISVNVAISNPTVTVSRQYPQPPKAGGPDRSGERASRPSSLLTLDSGKRGRRFHRRERSSPRRLAVARCAASKLKLTPNRSRTNRCTTRQFQLAIPMPAASGNSCTAHFSAACSSSPRTGGTTGLLEYQGRVPSLAEGRRPASDGVGGALQCLRRGRCRPTLGQEQHPVVLGWHRLKRESALASREYCYVRGIAL